MNHNSQEAKTARIDLRVAIFAYINYLTKATPKLNPDRLEELNTEVTRATNAYIALFKEPPTLEDSLRSIEKNFG